MERDWDMLHIVPVQQMNLAPRAEGYHGLDDWYDPRITEAAAALHGRYRYTAVVANYVWFSGVLEAFGAETLKVLDTHDVFGGRDQRFRDAGLAPEWFWTTRDEEARGLARADIVLAIQDEEAAQFRALGHRDVRVVGHLPAWRRRGIRRTATPAIGYLASSNPINVDSFRALRQAVLGQGGVKGARLLVAGAICDRLDAGAAAPFEGLPLVATEAAMTGLPVLHELHQLSDAAALAACLGAVAGSHAARVELAAASVACARAYGADVRRAVADLWQAIAA
jgi:hypothetical protein